MRTLLCLALIPTTLATALAALALPALAASPISAGDAVELKYDVEGHYQLENGRAVRLTMVEDRLYLDLNRSFRKELQPVGDRVLASRDGKLTVQYMPDGPVERILIQHPGLPASVRLGERSWRGR